MEQSNWIPVSAKEKPEDFEQVLATAEGFDEVVIAARWGKEWFLINDFVQKSKGDSETFKVLAWQHLPEIYKKKTWKLKSSQKRV